VDALQLVGERAQVFFNSVDAIEVLGEETAKLFFMLRYQLCLMGIDPLALSQFSPAIQVAADYRHKLPDCCQQSMTQ